MAGSSSDDLPVLDKVQDSKTLLAHIQTHFTKTDWEQNDSIISIYESCLFGLSTTEIGENLDKLLPPALLLVDHHDLDSKIQGVKFMAHIVSHASQTELCWYGRAEVIFDSLQKLMYTHEADLVDVLHPCLLKVLAVVEQDPRKADRVRAECRYDQIFHRLLNDMELENKLILRLSLSRQFPLYIKVLGITVLKNIKAYFRVAFSYLEVYDGPKERTRANILTSLKLVILECWPRMPYHCEEIVKALVRLIYDLSVDKTLTPHSVKDEVISQAVDCLILLKRACPSKTLRLVEALKSLELNERCNKCFDEMIQSE